MEAVEQRIWFEKAVGRYFGVVLLVVRADHRYFEVPVSSSVVALDGQVVRIDLVT
jgi:hypothetical protein